jgi:hypothetical protein
MPEVRYLQPCGPEVITPRKVDGGRGRNKKSEMTAEKKKMNVDN